MSVYRRVINGKSAGWVGKFSHGGVVYRKGGFASRAEAEHWHDSNRLARRRGDTGYVKVKTKALLEPLFEGYLASLDLKRRSEMYVNNEGYRLRKVAREAGWVVVGDVSPASFAGWRASAPRWKKVRLAPRTLNQYADTMRGFGAYLKDCGVWAINRMDELPKASAPLRQTYRRAATVEELQRLFAAVPPERALLYRFLVYVPIRRRAVEGLEWRDLDLGADRPTVTIRSELSKTKRRVTLPLRRELAAQLQAVRGEAEDGDRVFGRVLAVKAFRRDLAAAGIKFDSDDGDRRFDLHSFRKTAVRLLKSAGVSLDDAHMLLQHSDRATTAKHYDDDAVAPRLTDAADRMPTI